MGLCGILSILPSAGDTSRRKFEQNYKILGQNTGNLLFTNAVWRQIDGPKERINFSFDPADLNARLSALVIPAANWLSATVDFSALADLVEQLEIPVILIGLGAQDQGYSGHIDIPEGTQRFVRAVAKRSHSISVRGAYSQSILNGLGIENTTITGCPSLYMEFHGFHTFTNPRVRPERGLIHATRYSARHRAYADKPSVHRQLFRFAFAQKLDILFQSEPEELSLLMASSDQPEIDKTTQQNLCDIYKAPSWQALNAYILEHGRTYLDVDTWARALQHYDYVLGTRLHGTIMALNSGTPAVLIHHDSRTREMCEFAGIPCLPADRFKPSPKDIRRQIESADYQTYFKTRQNNRTRYLSFLHSNKLPVSTF